LSLFILHSNTQKSAGSGKYVWRSLFVIGYALLFAEVFFRVLNPIVMLPRYVVDSGYGIRGNWRSIDYTHYSPEYGDIDFRINANGIRADREYTYEKPPNTLRVLGFGDSFTIGFGAQQTQTFLARMEGSLQARLPCNVEVLNLGVSGFGSSESLAALSREGLRYSPDVVVFQWHETDLKDNMRSRLYRLENEHLVVEQEEFLPLVGLREKLFNIKAYRFIAANSMTYTWLRNTVARLTKKSLWRSGMQTAEEIDESISRDTGTPGTLLEQHLAVAILEEARAVTERNGAQFILLDVPDRRGRSRFRSTFPPNSSLEDVIYRPLDDFANHKGKMLYWEESAGHFSVLGNEIVGSGLAERVQSNCAVKSGSSHE